MFCLALDSNLTEAEWEVKEIHLEKAAGLSSSLGSLVTVDLLALDPFQGSQFCESLRGNKWRKVSHIEGSKQ